MNINTHTNINKSGGFTIIETLVAIAVLMIAISGPLVVASKGLVAAQYSRDQMIASSLAQEAMETIKNVKDNYTASNGSRNDWLEIIFGSDCYGVDTESRKCDAMASNNLFAGMSDSCSGLYGCPLYLSSGGYSNVENNGSPTIFSRYYYIWNFPGPASDEAKAMVVVTWNSGSIQNTIELYSVITNQLR